jgi:hypothetical protein
MRNLTKGHRSSVRRRCRALFIAAALAAVSTLPVRAADMEVTIDNFAFTPKGAHRESRDDNRLPQSRRHSP